MVGIPQTGQSSFVPQDIVGGESLLSFQNIPEIDESLLVAANDEVPEEESSSHFFENLAEILPENTLNGIASQLIEDIRNDKDSRKVWEENYIKGFSYLGLKPEDSKKVPFMQACTAFDTTLSEAHLHFCSIARAELFPSSGPVSYKVLGPENEQLDQQGDRVKKWMNHYLTQEDRDYYPDSERLLNYLCLVGCGFRKVYQDPVTNKPIARFIDPQDFIVNNNCVSILSSDRLTHVLYLSKKEIILRQRAGFYRDTSLPIMNESDLEESDTAKKIRSMEGIDLHTYENKSLFTIYEVHTDLDIKEDKYHKDKDLPLPYIVTIDATTRQILSIRRNWEEGDNLFKRKEFFVQYTYLPGFGIYGLGLMNLIGSNAMALTSITRQLIDTGTLKNFPGGLKVKGLRIENNDKSIGPSEFWDVETGGLPIRDAIMMMPYGEPSVGLMQLRNDLIQQTQNLAATAESKISEYQADAPVGTTLALLEVQGRLQSSILRGLHVSLNNELKLLYDLFGQTLPDEPYPFAIPGEQVHIMRQDFSDDIHITPISDPNLATSTQKMIKAEGILRIASSAPQIHDMRNVYHEVYESLGVKDIDKILPAEKEAIPLDPITENMNALEGKPIKAAMWQDHRAHQAIHNMMLQDQNTPDDVKANLMAHNRTHMAMQFMLDMQIKMGIQVPPLEQLVQPQIQNNIAMMAAKAAMEAAQAQQQQQIDPGQLMQMDIEQRREDSYLRHEEAKMKTEAEAFKSQQKFESEVYKVNANKEMAEEKNQTDIALAQMKST